MKSLIITATGKQEKDETILYAMGWR